MKQTARIISTYSADVFGVCSALFELGGMTVMHDASGCNSTYTTHDEPRWYDMDSMVYISGLSEMEAIMGDDEKLIGDIVDAAKDLQPRFIAVAGTPIPTMTGFDFHSIARLIEQETGIPTMGLTTTGMNTYVHGASMALAAYANRFVELEVVKTTHPSVNILGLTPLDFTVNGTDLAIQSFLKDAGFEVISKWAMGSSPEELAQAGRAQVNLVVSATGLGVAKVLEKRFGTPYVIGVPIGEACGAEVKAKLYKAVETGENQIMQGNNLQENEIVVIGEGITSLSLAMALEMELGIGAKVLCATECEEGILREKDAITMDEEEIEEALAGVKIVVADPLYRPICPAGIRFVALPSESFSGRMYRKEIPNLILEFAEFVKEITL